MKHRIDHTKRYETDCKGSLSGMRRTEEISEVRSDVVSGRMFAGGEYLGSSCLSQQDESLQSGELTEDIEDGKVIEHRQHSAWEIHEAGCPFQAHQRNSEHLLLLLKRFPVLHMRPDLEVIRREGNEVVVVRVHHNVSPQINQLDEVLLPRFRPAVRPRVRNHNRVDIEEGLGKANVEVGMEFAPVFGEVDRSPAAGDLGEVWGRVLDYVVGCEHSSGVEERPSFSSGLDNFRLVQADSKHLRRPVLGFAVPVPGVWSE